ncbi:hypothetical protein HRI_002164000 [Hibiscus trionum]|uniref:Reverse transcriptase domain-containing protein n=1 Tax=Hibiscus trionum TaxID=183268 RepID=A0A9W7M0I8_HIBTR|nr:hypothetical protein HRI_002164000 [Hibiscus trionum]
MKVITWNVRGLGKPRAVNRLKNTLRGINPHVLFLIETKLDVRRMERVRHRCGFRFGIDVGANGSKGGLSLGWKPDCNVTLSSYSLHHIDVIIKEDDVEPWRFTGFYGNPIESERANSWNLLRRLSTQHDMPWLVAGDFNEIMYSFEKMGRRIRPERNMLHFRDALNDCELGDLGFTGAWFTWERGNFANTNVRERLDRALATPRWWNAHPLYCVKHLVHSTSDHCPVLIDTLGHATAHSRQPVSLFKFDAHWVLEEEVEGLIKDVWEESDSVLHKLAKLGSTLSSWSKDKKHTTRASKKALLSRLQELSSSDPDDDNLQELIEVKLGLNLEADKDELFWEQRARSNWLSHGDSNTTFFHKFASCRQKKNHVPGLFDAAGGWITSDNELLRMATSYFSDLFTTSLPNDASLLLDNVQPKISNATNARLLQPFTVEEVWFAIKNMAPMKASGVDGYPALFYQKYWHIIGSDISAFCLSILNGSSSIREINDTLLVLIPKTKKPENMSHFRPISLCNVIYKIVAKVLAIRFSSTLDSCIDECQGAFIPTRQISDNILIAYEILHTMKNKRAGKHGSFAFKADLSKAYDRVEWPFLEKMLLKLGYDERWVQLLMGCISTVSYSVAFNGVVGEKFLPSRGLRQGCPLSPYLFLVCVEGLSILLNRAMHNRNLRGVTIGRGRLEIGHLFFADDSICFASASVESAVVLKDLLTQFGNVSGQCVNYDKSLLFFSTNVPTTTQLAIGNTLGVRIASNPERYLGLPTMVGRQKREAFSYYVDRVNKKSNTYSTKFLSMGGKATLIRSVLQAIPVYAMQCFLLPSSLCKALEQSMAKFWWRTAGTSKGIHWTSWNQLAYSKQEGGMGFRDLGQFNVALLAKQCWKLIKHPDSLLARVLKARYYPSTDFLHANLCSNPSYTWRSLWSARGLLETGLTWRIGNGESVNIWNDSWIPNEGDGRLRADVINIHYSKVADLIDAPAKCWKLDVLHRLFPDSLVSTISEIPLANSYQSDTLVWRHDNAGVYTVKSGYKCLRRNPTTPSGTPPLSMKQFYSHMWSLHVPEKIKIAMWRTVNNFLPTYENLQSRNLHTPNGCRFCCSSREGIEHLIRECWYSTAILEAQGISLPISTSILPWKEWITNAYNSLSDTDKKSFVVSCWAIWYARNKVVHENQPTTVEEAVAFIQAYIREHDNLHNAVQPTPSPRTQQWTAPHGNLIKANFDAAYCVQSKVSVSGVICRDNAGLIMRACTIKHQHVANVFLAEALACRDAVNFAKDLGLTRAIFEGDSLTIINKLNSSSADLSPLRVVIEDIKSAIGDLHEATFCHIRREGNMAAHTLAQHGRGSDTPAFWIEEAPVATTLIVERDRQYIQNSQ